MKNLILILLAGFALVACTEKIKEKVLTVPGEETPDQTGKTFDRNKVRSEKLVTAAEELITPIGFMFADGILDSALKADPSNRKAQFYKAFIAPFMKLRGILPRIAELSRSHPNLGRVYLQWVRTSGGLYDFLATPGGEKMNTEADIQKLMLEIQVEMKKLHNFILQNKTFVTRLSMPAINDYDKLLSGCMVERLTPDTFRLSPCPYMVQISLRANRGDWEVIGQQVNGARMGLGLGLSYDLEGLLSFFQTRYLKTAKQRMEFLERQPKLGRLLPQNQMPDLMARASDLHDGAKFVQDNQSQLCLPREEHIIGRICEQNIRAGRADFKFDAVVENLRISQVGAGGQLRLIKPIDSLFTGRPIMAIHLDLLAPFKNPVVNLKNLLPKTFDTCGGVLGYKEPTLGGVLKDGNADEILVISKTNCPATSQVSPP